MKYRSWILARELVLPHSSVNSPHPFGVQVLRTRFSSPNSLYALWTRLKSWPSPFLLGYNVIYFQCLCHLALPLCIVSMYLTRCVLWHVVCLSFSFLFLISCFWSCSLCEYRCIYTYYRHWILFLYISAIGCPDVEAPAGGWLQRSDQTVLMGCSHSSETWQLYCQDFVWIGQMRNCSPGIGLDARNNSARTTRFNNRTWVS